MTAVINRLALSAKIVLLAVPLVSFNITPSANAKDLGKHGNIFPIIEVDILADIQAKLQRMKSNGKLAEINEMMKQKTIASVNRPPAITSIGRAKEYKKWFYDPTITVQQDLKDHEGNIFQKAGTKINPLTRLPMTKKLFFINGDDRGQVDWVKKNRTERDKIILVAGSPIELMRKHKIRIYFDQKGILTSKFNIKNVPARVQQNDLVLMTEVLPL